MGMSDLNERLNQLEQGALNFLFPRRCPFCNQHIGQQGADLRRLRKEAALHRGPGRPPDLLGPGGRASVLRGRRPRAILDFKFKGRMGGLPLLRQPDGRCAAEEFGGEFDAITWVPVSRKRLAQAGL